MSVQEFSVKCYNCNGEVNSFKQTLQYILSPKAAVQESQSIELSCGCTIDFPDWKIDLNTGNCRIQDFAGNVFVKFYDEELIMIEDDDD
jgi:hypothetical protein